MFCHKCGKPQVELPVVEAPPPPAPPILPVSAPPQPAGISFRNRLAVRIGLLAAALASLLTSLPMPMFLNVVWMLVCLVGSGFFAVYLYKRKSGEDLSTVMGARMGWITGVFCFVIATIFFTITIIAISMQGGLSTFYREQVATQAGAGVDLEEFYKLLENPAGLASIIIFSLLLLFFFFTLLPTLGGVMGAKVLEKE
jgi:hypothetical protein